MRSGRSRRRRSKQSKPEKERYKHESVHSERSSVRSGCRCSLRHIGLPPLLLRPLPLLKPTVYTTTILLRAHTVLVDSGMLLFLAAAADDDGNGASGGKDIGEQQAKAVS